MRWASAFLNRTATKLCAMIGNAVVRRIPMGSTRAEAPERSGRRSLIQDVHACHHARGELRVCQARIMHIQRRGIPHRCHVRAHAALSTWRIEHMAQCDLRQCCSHNALPLTSQAHFIARNALGRSFSACKAKFCSMLGKAVCGKSIASLHQVIPNYSAGLTFFQHPATTVCVLT